MEHGQARVGMAWRAEPSAHSAHRPARPPSRGLRIRAHAWRVYFLLVTPHPPGPWK